MIHATLRLAFSLLLPAIAHAGPSDLWGTHGQRWSPDSRLPDFSYAGYHNADRPLPDVPVATSVKAHGAKGDGRTDDTPAFLKALASLNPDGGAILIPPGRYVLGQPIVIDRPNIVLRGSGAARTTLLIPKSLQELSPKNLSTDAKLSYSFGGAFLHIKGRDNGARLATIATPANRGTRTLTLSTPTSLKNGDTIRLLQGNDPSLGRHLHGDLLDAGEATFSHKTFVDFSARVVSVDGSRLTLDRPLRTDVRPEWNAELRATRPTVREVGIERLTIEFPGTPKKPHLQEEGFNAIHFDGALDCWVRDVTIIDADLGIKFDASRNCTVSNITIKAARRENPTGHHALWVSGRSQDVLFDTFDIQTRFVHDITVEGFSHGNVFTRGRAVILNLDHHRNAPYANLFTQLHTADVSRLWQSSGRGDRGPHAAAWNTLWTLTYDRGDLPKVPNWPLLNVIGVPGYTDHKPADHTPWIELSDENVTPANLYDAQRRLRTAR